MPRRRTHGHRVIQFIEENCVHPDGPLVGQPLLLHPWWKQTILELFEVVWSAEEQRWKRRYSEALIGIAKKNSKTSLGAALALYFLLADGDPSAYVISAAASEEQGANLLYGSARTMCELSPTLKQVTQSFDKEILVPSLSRARMRNVATKAGTQDGANARAVICDEFHEWLGQRGRDLYTVLRGSLATRPDAISIAITTAGFDQESICFEKYEYGQKVTKGEIDDPRFYFKWVEAPDDCDHTDPAIWKLANPMYGVSVQVDYLQDRCARETESKFRRYHLNQWVSAENIWIPAGVWQQCYAPELELDPSLPLFVGIDIARNVDSSAVAMVQKRETPDGPRYVVRVKVWENPYPENDPRYADWRMNNNLVMEHCRDLFARYPVPATTIDDEIKPGPAFAFDPWRFRPEAEALTGEGLAMVEYPQSDSRMVPASQACYETIVQRQLAHNGDAALRRHVHNVVADQKERGWRISKPRGSHKKIDAAVATAIAIYLAQTSAPIEPVSKYETDDLLVL